MLRRLLATDRQKELIRQLELEAPVKRAKMEQARITAKIDMRTLTRGEADILIRAAKCWCPIKRHKEFCPRLEDSLQAGNMSILSYAFEIVPFLFSCLKCPEITACFDGGTACYLRINRRHLTLFYDRHEDH